MGKDARKNVEQILHANPLVFDVFEKAVNKIAALFKIRKKKIFFSRGSSEWTTLTKKKNLTTFF